MKDCTLCVILDEGSGRILLAMKKRGFGEGKFNCAGGKVNEGEDVKSAAVRETVEEIGVEPLDPVKVGELAFLFEGENPRPEWNQTVHLYLSRRWSGDPTESDEMRPEWFDFSDIPYGKMWSDDIHWLPKVLDGKKVSGTFRFGGERGDVLLGFELEENGRWR